MPYVITTTNPDRDGEPMEDQTSVDLDGTTRTAVASLFEASDAAMTLVSDAGDWTTEPLADMLEMARELPDEGGIIGPLPDGTVIEVRWRDHA